MAFFRRDPAPEEFQVQQEQQEREDSAQARRERQVRTTAADIDEVKSICQSALEAINARGEGLFGPIKAAVREVKLTRGGLIVRGSVFDKYGEHSDKAPASMRQALTDLGFVVDKTFGRDGVIVTGWDPHHYEGNQLTSVRIQKRLEELQEVREELLELEASDVQVRNS